jgi:lipopolysaccharide/colanic/teichoic acid biosynthesis glycosyltransferase
MQNMLLPKVNSGLNGDRFMAFDVDLNLEILDQKPFLRMLALERKRTERSLRRFVLMLLDCGSLLKGAQKAEPFAKILSALSKSTRDTDITGWYKDRSVIGVIFTELGGAEGGSVASALLAKVTNALCGTLSINQINQISLSFHVYPEDDDSRRPDSPADSTLYPDLVTESNSRRDSLRVKRSMDVAGSMLALVCFSPLLAIIAIAVKLTSKGPILFRQERIGQFGKSFTFLKFRSMYFKNDHTIHREYIKRLISAKADSDNASQGQSYKLTADPRVTPLGRFLRRTSLDELPQLLNVLTGEMSLVGPRPPVPYEFEAYHVWHKHRLLGAKPGITGVWQVEGRSRVKFDEMVRMDLRYARSWSLALDIKILLRTPKAVLSGAGAY